MSGDRTAPSCAAEQSATPGQLIEGRGSARIARSTRRGRPGFGREGPGTQEQVACTQRATLPVTSGGVSAQQYSAYKGDWSRRKRHKDHQKPVLGSNSDGENNE